MNDYQFGFRAHRSTTMAVVKMVENISQSVDKKLHTIGVFLDLQKAFDTIDHRILLYKLEKYGFRGIVYSWLENYLTDHFQYVDVNGVGSMTYKAFERPIFKILEIIIYLSIF